MPGLEILLGVSGGISAYKSCDLLRRLQDYGFGVTVLPTRASLNFVGTATWEALSGREIPVDLWNNVHQVPHISLAKKSDAIVIAPATADIIGKIANGLADDLLTNVVIASKAPLVLVPAMHTEMWNNPATVANVQTLRERGVHIIEPDVGALTSGDVGAGRYPESQKIIDGLLAALDLTLDYRGVRVLIGAGGTREPIDPVRFIGNRSSGKQGYALAEAALRRGAQVTMVSANAVLPDIAGVRTIHVSSTAQMQSALTEEIADADVLIMAAAVADARPATYQEMKLEKVNFSTLELVANPDILASLAPQKGGRVFVGFAAQTLDADEGGLAKAQAKLEAKGLDFIYFNDVSGGAIFGSDETEGTVLSSNGTNYPIQRSSKMTLSNNLLDLIRDKLG